MCFHPLHTNIEEPTHFTNPFRYAPHPLCLAAVEEVKRHLLSSPAYTTEIELGKMFGVLVVKDKDGQMGFLAAFSGLLCGSNNLPYFVPAIYDILNPSCQFKQGEEVLNDINRKIKEIENSDDYTQAKETFNQLIKEKEQVLQDLKDEAATKKNARKRLREEGNLSELQLQQLIKESQFEKAEIKRMRDSYDIRINAARSHKEEIERQVNALKQERKILSDQLQRWIFDQYVVRNAKGEEKNLTDIFDEETGTLPPAGTGECAAPKLLQYAFLHHMQPLCMAEFWWGKSPTQQLRRHLYFYPACSSKCKPMLHFMLQGMNLDNTPINNSPTPTAPNILDNHSLAVALILPPLYEDEHLAVINKPSGLLSVKGKSGAPSVEDILATTWNSPAYMVHRLDMDTSGLLVVAKDKRTQQTLQAQFSNHKVIKRYKAIVDGDIKGTEGDINLPLRPDIMDRPRQMVDHQHGKTATTHYKVIMRRTDAEGRTTTVLHLYPKTGRTHQLRVHCAHPQGLNAPIIGDYLYGNPASRLLLHAEYIEFIHPITHLPLHITSPSPF